VRAVDAAVLAKLTATGLTVHDGRVETDDTGKVVLSPLPYVVFYSSLGRDGARRQGGNARRLVPFRLVFVGATREQAKWTGEKADAALTDRVVTVDGREHIVERFDNSGEVRRDDDVVRPDGGPLFYGSDQYGITVTR
jgi:hypothetical protein